MLMPWEANCKKQLNLTLVGLTVWVCFLSAWCLANRSGFGDTWRRAVCWNWSRTCGSTGTWMWTSPRAGGRGARCTWPAPWETTLCCGCCSNTEPTSSRRTVKGTQRYTPQSTGLLNTGKQVKSSGKDAVVELENVNRHLLYVCVCFLFFLKPMLTWLCLSKRAVQRLWRLLTVLESHLKTFWTGWNRKR